MPAKNSKKYPRLTKYSAIPRKELPTTALAMMPLIHPRCRRFWGGFGGFGGGFGGFDFDDLGTGFGDLFDMIFGTGTSRRASVTGPARCRSGDPYGNKF